MSGACRLLRVCLTLVVSLAQCAPTRAMCDFIAANSTNSELFGEAQILSPNYPGSFSDCTAASWELTARDNCSVFLRFDEFDVLGGTDLLFVYGANQRLQAKLTGYVSNRTMILPSGSRLMFFSLRNLSSGGRRRFRIEFTSLADPDEAILRSQLMDEEAPVAADGSSSSSLADESDGYTPYLTCDAALLTSPVTVLRYVRGQVAYVACREGLSTEMDMVNGSIVVECDNVTGEWTVIPFCKPPPDVRWEEWRRTKLVITIGVIIAAAMLSVSAFGTAYVILKRRTSHFNYQQFSNNCTAKTRIPAAGRLPLPGGLPPASETAGVFVDMTVAHRPTNCSMTPTHCVPQQAMTDVAIASV